LPIKTIWGGKINSSLLPEVHTKAGQTSGKMRHTIHSQMQWRHTNSALAGLTRLWMILGLATWSRIAGLGEAIAGIKNVAGDAEFICTSAVDYRIRRAKKLVGEKFELSGDKDWNAYNIILQSIPGRMLDVDEGYRGTGPAGAMVYAGLAEFVSESDIWRGELKPGAAIQVWRHQEAYDLLLVGEKDENGKKRRINDGDANFSGTSFVFVRYDTNANERMWVRHYGSTDPMNKTRYEKWVAANIK